MYRLLIVAFLFLASACRVPPPGTPLGDVIQCGGDTFQKCWPEALPAVNSCLALDGGEQDWRQCLTSVIAPTGCLVESVVACVIRDSGMKAHAAAHANPDDVRSQRMANRAAAWIDSRGYKFAD